MNTLAHFSDGLDIGQRLDQVVGVWMVAGENLGEGQNHLTSSPRLVEQLFALQIMLMNPK